uniref:Alpha-2-HS-glycoprotein n=1 Tax=Neovison vison TaxID=452646 RepID=A0A8C7BL63_NEOVI
MRTLTLLLCLAQLLGCRSVPVGTALAYREPNCDDPETEQAALAAVDYINNRVLRGYKHTLNQIDKVRVWPRVSDCVWSSTGPPCTPRPTPALTVGLFLQAVEGDCDLRVLKQDGQFSVLFAKCDSSPDSAEDVRRLCPGCPLLAPLNDTKVVHAVDVALTAFNAQSNGSYFQLVEISRAQFVPLPQSTYVEFAVAATDCAAKDVTDPAKCNLLAEKQNGFCKATLMEKVGGEDVAVTCTVFQTQPQPGDAVADPAVPAPSPANLLADPLLVGPVVVALPEAPLPGHRAHYDLRHAFAGVASVESASGEAFHVGKAPKVVQPNVAVAAGPLVHPCPGRIRYFKV